MPERRMFAKTIIDSDAFLDMPISAQLLYFHLSMRADDDGFVNKPKSIMRVCGCKDDDIQILFAKKFVIPFESGIVVIKHWKIHNYIRNVRYKETKYKEEKNTLCLDENNAYTQSNNMLGIPNGNQMETQDRLGQVSSVEDSIGEENKAKPKPVRHKFGEYKNVLLSDEDVEKLKTEFPTDWVARIENLSSYIASTGKSYKNHLATIRNWARKETPRETARPKPQSDYDKFMGKLQEMYNEEE